MKSQFRLIIAGLAMMLVSFAHAGVSVTDVDKPFDANKDYRQMESAIRERIANDPNNAPAHYLYSRLLQHDGKRDEAMHQLAEAKRLDPALSFVRDPAQVAAYEAQLNSEGAATIASKSNRVRLTWMLGKVFLWLLLSLGAFGIAALFVYHPTKENQRKIDKKRLKVTLLEQARHASALLELARSYKLDICMANPTDLTLLLEVEKIEREVAVLIDRLWLRQVRVAHSEIYRQSERLARLRRKFKVTGAEDFADKRSYQHLVSQKVDLNDSNARWASGLLRAMVPKNLIIETATPHEITELPILRIEDRDSELDIDFESGNSGQSLQCINDGNLDDI